MLRREESGERVNDFEILFDFCDVERYGRGSSIYCDFVSALRDLVVIRLAFNGGVVIDGDVWAVEFESFFELVLGDAISGELGFCSEVCVRVVVLRFQGMDSVIGDLLGVGFGVESQGYDCCGCQG